jgi:hypothetical protein
VQCINCFTPRQINALSNQSTVLVFLGILVVISFNSLGAAIRKLSVSGVVTLLFHQQAIADMTGVPTVWAPPNSVINDLIFVVPQNGRVKNGWRT